MKNTIVKYMYRDGSNYKFFGEFVVCGNLTFDNLVPFLHEKEFFIPHEIGLDHLLNLPMNQDDHYLHTFESFEATDEIDYICSAEEFLERMCKANNKGWFSSFYESRQIQS